ncbi:DUF6776 family protein [Aliidiomarina sanyensis]|uniref:Uncharacterized protein n=1 Tax=Aliidiomarina sanyensis TaxID=1249555 RepID=A0A432WCR8_9GAMM|nr:DUF6776 family protein [Aliidiomarina sanyensis]RUO30156.1 hypothetical protein CWE11_09370 [Aliidiomarina sanyensis]
MTATPEQGRFYQFLRYAGVAVVFVILGFFGGNARLNYLEQSTRLQENQRQTLHQRVDRLEYRNNILQVELDVERAANRALQNEIREALDENASIRRELAFYQRVMAPELDADGVTIDSFHISPISADRGFYFRLILLQLERIEQLMTGTIVVTVRGHQGNQRRDLNLLELAGLEGDANRFAMNYFALTEGSFVLPEGFVPDTVQVQVRARGGRQTERYFPWDDLISESLLPESPES